MITAAAILLAFASGTGLGWRFGRVYEAIAQWKRDR